MSFQRIFYRIYPIFHKKAKKKCVFYDYAGWDWRELARMVVILALTHSLKICQRVRENGFPRSLDKLISEWYYCYCKLDKLDILSGIFKKSGTCLGKATFRM